MQYSTSRRRNIRNMDTHKKTIFTILFLSLISSIILAFPSSKLSHHENLAKFLTIAICVLILHFKHTQSEKKIIFYLKNLILPSIYTVAKFTLLTASSIAVCSIIYFHLEQIPFISSRLDHGLIFSAILLAFTVAIIEEIFFRSFLLSALNLAYRKFLSTNSAWLYAAFTQALIFTAWHAGQTWLSLLPTIIMVALLTHLRLRTGSIAAGIAVHASWNGCQDILFGLHKPYLNQHAGLLLYSPNEDLFIFSALGLTTLTCLLAARKNRANLP